MKKILLGFSVFVMISIVVVQGVIIGVGVSFFYFLYFKMFSEYKVSNVNYQLVGLGSGQKQILECIVDFVGSDNFMIDVQLGSVFGILLYVFIVIGVVVFVYNLFGVIKFLNFDGFMFVNIYFGKIKIWGDFVIVKFNFGVIIFLLLIIVVCCFDGLGIIFVFLDYLSKVSGEWKSKVGVGNSFQWFVGIGVKGNDGVVGVVKGIFGVIGYVELVYVKQNKLFFGVVKNCVGKFILVDNGFVSNVVLGVVIFVDICVSLINSVNVGVYLIVSFIYLIFYKDQKYGNCIEVQVKVFKNLFIYVVISGQQYNEGFDYVKLFSNVVVKVKIIINLMNYGGKKF